MKLLRAQEKKQWQGFKMKAKTPYKSLKDTRGQAVVELAIFGSILIFCFAIFLRYTMSLNYQQQVMMEGFRRGFILAKTGYVPGTETTISGKDGFREVNYVLIKDKPIPDPSNPYGVAERVPVGTSVSAIWSQDIFAELEGLETEIPRIMYEINDDPLKSYTTAKFSEHSLISPLKRENKKNWNGEGAYWNWKPVEQHKVGAGDALDIDYDDQEETVVSWGKDENGNENKGAVLVLDMQEGEVDLSGNAEESGGLSKDYEIVRKSLSPSTFQRKETHDQISTTTNINFEEKITRYIKRRATDAETIDTIESPFVTKKSQTWTTPH